MTETKRLVEHFFRHEYANLVSSLTRVFGFSRIDLVEDMVGSAMLQAMNSWRQNGIPDKPVAWMHRVARNKVLDVIRREKTMKKQLVLPAWHDQKRRKLFRFFRTTQMKSMMDCCG